MARGKLASVGKRTKEASVSGGTGTGTEPVNADQPGLKLPSPKASTNLAIANIVLRAAGGLLRDRLEKGLITRHHGDDAKAHRLVDKRGLAASAALWGASHLARRSPIGLAVVVGGLAAKVFYDRGKGLEAKRAAKKPREGES